MTVEENAVIVAAERYVDLLKVAKLKGNFAKAHYGVIAIEKSVEALRESRKNPVRRAAEKLCGKLERLVRS